MKQVFKIIATALLFFSKYAAAQVSVSTPPKDGSWCKIQVVQTGKCLSVENAGTDNGVKIIQADYAGSKNQKFQVKKNEDGTYSFFAGHSNKSICADKGDNREGDLVIQNTLSQFFGKWHLSWLNNCGQGWKIQYKSTSGKPMQPTGVNAGDPCKLIQPIYQDGAEDCPYLYHFIPVDAPVITTDVPKAKTVLPRTPAAVKKNGQ